MDAEPRGLPGVSACDEKGFSGYYVGVASNAPCPPDMEEYEVPVGIWAVFECTGSVPEAMQNLQRRTVTEWLPGSGYEYASAPDIERFFEGDQNAADYRSEVWLPIVRK